MIVDRSCLEHISISNLTSRYAFGCEDIYIQANKMWPLIPTFPAGWIYRAFDLARNIRHTEVCAVFKGTNGRQKTYEIFHVYCIFYSGFMCQTTVIFGITKNGSLVLNTLASWNCFTCRNLFQNGANDMSECLTFETAFCKKAQNFV